MRRFLVVVAPEGGAEDELMRTAQALPRRDEMAWFTSDDGALACVVCDDDGFGPRHAARGAWVGAGDVRLDNRADVECWVGGQGAVTDLELVLDALARRGASCVPDLLGDFAFVAWNTCRHELIAARDAFGVRTLFVRPGADHVALSSHAAPLDRDDRYDIAFLAEFLLTGQGPRGQTIHAGVSTIPAGSILHQTRATRRVTTYWSPDAFEVEAQHDRSDAVAEFQMLFERAVTLRLAGPRHTWAQLSGGLDSSSIVCVAGSATLGGTVTYTDSLAADEQPFVDAVSARVGIGNVTVGDAWLWQDDGAGAPHTDEPKPSFALYARDRRLVETVRRAGGRVLLSGQGSDHYLTGNLYFFADTVARGHILRAARELAHWSIRGRTSFWRFAFDNAVLPLLPSAMQRRFVKGGAVPDWLPRRVAARFDLEETVPALRMVRPARGHQYARTIAYYMSTIDVGLDRGVIHDALEVRYPFLYRPLVEFGLRLPRELRTQPYARKWILRESMRGVLPELVRTRTTKAVIDARILWSLQHERARLMAMLREPLLADLGLIEPDRLRDAVDRATRGDVQRYGEVLAPLTLEMWLRVRSGRWASARAALA